MPRSFSSKAPKYHNHKVEHKGQKFDSEIEVARWLYLQNRESEGEITNLRRQVEFPLLPTQYKEVKIRLKTKEKTERRVVEKACVYNADFVYTHNGKMVVEDVKGSKFLQTEAFRLKKKLMYYFYQIEIALVTSPTENVK